MYNQGYQQQAPYPPQSNYPPQQPYPQQPYSQQPYPRQAPYPQTGAYPPQQPYAQPGAYPPQQPYPPQGVGYGREPLYRQITVGRGIDMNEYNSIVGAIKYVYMQGTQPMATACADGIRRAIGGDWFVFISDVGIEDFDFSLTRVRGGDFIAFSLDSKKFQVCRIR